MWYVYVWEYYAATKKARFESFVGQWLDLEAII